MRDLAVLHLIVLAWGTSAVIALGVTPGPLEIVIFRTLTGAAILGLILCFKRPQFTPSQLVRPFFIGLLVGVHWWLFFLAGRLSNASTSLIGLATSPLWVVGFSLIREGKKPQLKQLFFALSVLTGIVIIFFDDGVKVPGLLVSILSAMCSAYFSMVNEKLMKTQDPLLVSFVELLGAALLAIVLVGIKQQTFTWPKTSDILPLLFLGVVCTGMAQWQCLTLMQRISAYEVNLAINMEPVYGIILANIVYGSAEQMGISFIIGGGIVALSVLTFPLLRSHPPTPLGGPSPKNPL